MTRTAKDYPITTPYGYTGHPYSPVRPHRGNDRKMPIGVPIVIAKVVIGYSGNTGLFNGQKYEPHSHTQAGTDKECQKDVNPTPYEFQPGTVVAVGVGPEWGKYITMRTTSGVYITYCHLSQINVTVGQKIKGEDDSMTQQEAVAILDSFYGRFTGRKVKQSELDEYVPAFLEGQPDKFFKKAAQFDEVKNYIGSTDAKPLEPGVYKVL